jgi:transitional endoplasmic reticulum ATPase
VEREYEQMAARLKQEANAIQPIGFIAPGQLTARPGGKEV